MEPNWRSAPTVGLPSLPVAISAYGISHRRGGSARRLHRRRRQVCSTPTSSGVRGSMWRWNADAEFRLRHMSAQQLIRTSTARETPDMVIFTLPQWKARAEQLADIHRAAPQNLKVLVVNAEQVYNEFSSGTPDIGGIPAACSKMMWDRGRESANPATGSDSKLQYALMFRTRFLRPSRHHPRGAQLSLNSILPQWQSIDGETDNVSPPPQKTISLFCAMTPARIPARTIIASGRPHTGQQCQRS